MSQLNVVCQRIVITNFCRVIPDELLDAVPARTLAAVGGGDLSRALVEELIVCRCPVQPGSAQGFAEEGWTA